VQQLGDVDEQHAGNRLRCDPRMEDVDDLRRVDGERAVDVDLGHKVLEFHGGSERSRDHAFAVAAAGADDFVRILL
jgi:hypothetical protein